MNEDGFGWREGESHEESGPVDGVEPAGEKRGEEGRRGVSEGTRRGGQDEETELLRCGLETLRESGTTRKGNFDD